MNNDYKALTPKQILAMPERWNSDIEFARAIEQATITNYRAQQEPMRDEIQRLAQFADQALRMSPNDMRNNLEDIADRLSRLLAVPPTAQPAQDDMHKRLFEAAIRDLAAINEYLGLDPDDGGAVPIIEAIKELQAAQAAAVPEEVRDALMDSQYLAGVGAGWNAAQANDPNAAHKAIHDAYAGYLKPLRDWQKSGRPSAAPTPPASAAPVEPMLDTPPASAATAADGGSNG